MADILGGKKQSRERSLSAEWSISSSLLYDRSLSILEAITWHLKEEKKCTLRRIADLLHRDERTIWTCYARAKKKRSLSKPQLRPTSSVDIPLRIFHDRTFSSLEVLVKYLKEEKALSFREISTLLHRNERTIWTCYARTKKKILTPARAPAPRDLPTKLPASAYRYKVPSSLLSNRALSVLEAITVHLKEKEGWSFRHIGYVLKRDERTIWTCYSRAKKKPILAQRRVSVVRSFLLPLAIFQDRRFSSLEGIVVYLKERQGLSFREIGDVLHRDERTIWTCYHRSLKKMAASHQHGGDLR